MSLIGQALALGLIVSIFFKGIEFHRSTTCRQTAWQEGFDLATRSLLNSSSKIEYSWNSKCKIKFIRKDQLVIWQKKSELKRFVFQLNLTGHL